MNAPFALIAPKAARARVRRGGWSWGLVERDAGADRGEARTEVLWINPAADQARKAGPLFSSMEAA